MITIYSNAICAQKVLNKIKDENTKNFLSSHMPVYMFGSVSYSILEAFDIFSKEPNTWIRNLENTIAQSGNKFFDICKKYIAKAPKDEKDILCAYLSGCALHKALVYRTAPYLKYALKDISDIKPQNETVVKLDCAYCTEEKQTFDFANVLEQLSAKEIVSIENMYRFLINELQREIIPENILEDCVAKLKKALTQKKSIFKKAGREFIYAPLNDPEILNAAHKNWNDPQNPAEKNNFSYPELVAYAERDSVKTLPKFLALVQRALANESCEFLFRNMK